jgi:large-conductance mechanosensitive channel
MAKITANGHGAVHRKSLRTTLGHFLSAGDLLPLILAVYLGDVLEKFFGSITQGIIMPTLSKIHLTYFIHKAGLDKDGKHKSPKELKDWSINVWGIEFGVGKVLDGLIRFMLAIWVAYLFSHYFVKGFLNN